MSAELTVEVYATTVLQNLVGRFDEDTLLKLNFKSDKGVEQYPQYVIAKTFNWIGKNTDNFTAVRFISGKDNENYNDKIVYTQIEKAPDLFASTGVDGAADLPFGNSDFDIPGM